MAWLVAYLGVGLAVTILHVLVVATLSTSFEVESISLVDDLKEPRFWYLLLGALLLWPAASLAMIYAYWPWR